MEIQLQQDGRETGPFSWIEIFVMLQKGAITHQTPACLKGEGDWKTINDLGLWRKGSEIGPFSWEDISYLISEGYLEGEIQIHLREEDGIIFPKVADGDESAPEPVAQFRDEDTPKQWLQEVGTAIASIFPAFLKSWRLHKKELLYAALVSSGFFAGWIFKGIVVATTSEPLQPSISSATPETNAESIVARKESLTAPLTQPSRMPSHLADIPETAVPIEAHHRTEAVTPLPAPSPKAEPGDESSKIAEEFPTPAAPIEQAGPYIGKDNPSASVEAKEPPTSKADGQATPSEISVKPTPSPALQITTKPEKRESGFAEKITSITHQTSSRIEPIRPFAPPQLTQDELEELLQERFSSIPIKILDSYDARPGKGLQIHEGFFTLETKLIHNPTVDVVYRTPQYFKNRVGPDAHNIVMVGIYHGAIKPREKRMIDGNEITEKSRLHGALAPFADQLGYTAFTLHIASSPEMASDKREYYAYGGPEWVDIVFRAKAEIERRHKLKARKLLLFGISEGGQFVQNIAAAVPDKVAAITTQSGPDITPPECTSDAAWFLAITRGDAMQNSYEAVYNRLLEQRANFVFNIFPPNYRGRGRGGNFYHSQSPVATLASRSFLRGVVDNYDSTGVIDRTKWPYVRNRTKPLRIYPSGSLQAKAIPSENREYLPSRAFAQCLQAIPAQMQTVSLTTTNNATLKAFVGVPPLGKPKGVIIYLQAFNILDMQHMLDNVYYLAEKGYVVIAPQIKKKESRDILNAMQYVRNSSLLGKFPMAVLGYGEKANVTWNIIARNRNISPKAVAMLEFTPLDSFDESKLPPGCQMDAPVVFVYDEQPLVAVSTSDEAKKSREVLSEVDNFITKCRKRNQLAKVVIISKPAPPKNPKPIAPEVVQKNDRIRVAQLSLEAAEDFITNVVEQKTNRITR